MIDCRVVEYMIKYKLFWRKRMKKNWLAIGITSSTIIIAFFCFYYLDFITLTIWSTNILDTIIETGSLWNYYVYSVEHSSEIYHIYVGGDIFIYLPWAIWNIPIWGIQKIFNIRIVEQVGMLLYSKLFLVVVSGGVLWIENKILIHLDIKRDERLAVLGLSVSSLFLITSIFYAGQNDIVAMFPFIYGLYVLMKGKKKHFLFAAIISIMCKPFYLFSYVAIICYKEKKLTTILLSGIYVVVGMMAGKLIFWQAPLYQESLNQGPSEEVMGMLFSITLPVTPEGISVFLVAIGVVFLLAYFTTPKEDVIEQAKELIYYASAPVFLLLLMTTQEFYRGVYLVPLWYLLMGIKKEYKRINVLLEMIISIAFSYQFMVNNFLYYSAKYIGIKGNNQELPSFFYVDLIYDEVILSSIISLAIITVLIINHPRFVDRNKQLCMEPEKGLVVIRSLIYSLPTMSALLIYILFSV